MTELEARIILNMLPGLGSIGLKRLLEHFKTARQVLEAQGEDLQRFEGLPKNFLSNVALLIKKGEARKELELIEKEKVDLVCWDEPGYPKLLKEIFDPPALLYVKGAIPEDMPTLAIVGSRRASLYGLKVAHNFAVTLVSWGLTIVSGMARGIDSAAHKGALKAGGKTIAVLGSGLSCIYPPENKALAKEISQHGAVISEFPMTTAPFAQNFPRRNRIISGLSLGVLVVEAARRSGALITVNCALEQGREVFAIPGKTDSPTSWGTHQLIKEGAKLVDEPSEIIHEFNLDSLNKSGTKDSKTTVRSRALSEEERAIVDFLSDEPVFFDQIARECNLPITQLMSDLTRLEIKGMVKQLPGKRFIINQ